VQPVPNFSIPNNPSEVVFEQVIEIPLESDQAAPRNERLTRLLSSRVAKGSSPGSCPEKQDPLPCG
jgi:hypothetical protein